MESSRPRSCDARPILKHKDGPRVTLNVCKEGVRDDLPPFNAADLLDDNIPAR